MIQIDYTKNEKNTEISLESFNFLDSKNNVVFVF